MINLPKKKIARLGRQIGILVLTAVLGGLGVKVSQIENSDQFGHIPRFLGANLSE